LHVRHSDYGVGVASRVSHTSINCTNAFELSEWWKQLLGYADVAGDPNEAGDEECMIVDPESGHQLLFIEVEDLQESDGRIHLDLAPTDRRRDDEIERAVALGAIEVADRRNADGTGWMVLADPAGNLFCIVRSDEERRST
jgi:catechol 2,3-dioxygenase-like lactoylglutathione lyase family enzyme